MFIWISELELSAAVKSQYIWMNFPRDFLYMLQIKKLFFKVLNKKKNSRVLKLNTRVYKKVIVFLKTQEKRYSLQEICITIKYTSCDMMKSLKMILKIE